VDCGGLSLVQQHNIKRLFLNKPVQTKGLFAHARAFRNGSVRHIKKKFKKVTQIKNWIYN